MACRTLHALNGCRFKYEEEGDARSDSDYWLYVAIDNDIVYWRWSETIFGLFSHYCYYLANIIIKLILRPTINFITTSRHNHHRLQWKCFKNGLQNYIPHQNIPNTNCNEMLVIEERRFILMFEPRRKRPLLVSILFCFHNTVTKHFKWH